MDKEKLVQNIVGGISAGFFIGVGFLLAQKTVGKLFSKKQTEEKTTVADAVKEGVKEGVKQARMEEDAAKYASMVGENGNGRSSGNRAKRRMANQYFMGFDGNPTKMDFDSNPLKFGTTPNSSLNTF